jgi:hypothetical protein
MRPCNRSSQDARPRSCSCTLRSAARHSWHHRSRPRPPFPASCLPHSRSPSRTCRIPPASPPPPAHLLLQRAPLRPPPPPLRPLSTSHKLVAASVEEVDDREDCAHSDDARQHQRVLRGWGWGLQHEVSGQAGQRSEPGSAGGPERRGAGYQERLCTQGRRPAQQARPGSRAAVRQAARQPDGRQPGQHGQLPTRDFLRLMALSRPATAGKRSPTLTSFSLTLSNTRRCSSRLLDTLWAWARMSSTCGARWVVVGRWGGGEVSGRVARRVVGRWVGVHGVRWVKCGGGWIGGWQHWWEAKSCAQSMRSGPLLARPWLPWPPAAGLTRHGRSQLAQLGPAGCWCPAAAPSSPLRRPAAVGQHCQAPRPRSATHRAAGGAQDRALAQQRAAGSLDLRKGSRGGALLRALAAAGLPRRPAARDRPGCGGRRQLQRQAQRAGAWRARTWMLSRGDDSPAPSSSSARSRAAPSDELSRLNSCGGGGGRAGG